MELCQRVPALADSLGVPDMVKKCVNCLGVYIYIQWNLDYPNTDYPNSRLSEHQIDCSIRVFCQKVYVLLE